MSEHIDKIAFWLYNLGWGAVIPILHLNQRLAEGFGQRKFQHRAQKADLWIQAASAGESYLARGILKNLKPLRPVRIIVTSNTTQGIEILKQTIDEITPGNKDISVCAAYFPFDKPAIMETAVREIQPRVMVLLESEIWPGLLRALKKHRCKILIINGRITSKSLRRYLIWPSLWHSLRPDRILAVSKTDARRFAKLFSTENVDVMPNMKFDRIVRTRSSDEKNPLKDILGPGRSLIVLGSTSQEEEPLVEKIILSIRQSLPEAVIGLFPRHMHRLGHWQDALDRMALPWILRSEISKVARDGSPGTVILWDTFGELGMTYELSKAAFVGGSLAPVGGQNFLEPLTCGVTPVIGPHWEAFDWVGREIADQGLVRIAGDWKEVADVLIENMNSPLFHEKVREAALKYMENRQGGTVQACCLVEKYLG